VILRFRGALVRRCFPGPRLARRGATVSASPFARRVLTCPEVEVGTVIGDVMRRRCSILGIEVRGDERVMRAEVPLAEMFGYAGALSGLTHGCGRFT